MGKFDINALLRRGGIMTPAEESELARELTSAKLYDMANGTLGQTMDQPVRVVPFIDVPPVFAYGYFTQQKFIWYKTPEEMERILGIFGKLAMGACVLQFLTPLSPTDYENKAYTYLPGGMVYEPDPNEKTYLPGDGAPQWRLKVQIPAKCMAKLKPGERFDQASLLS